MGEEARRIVAPLYDCAEFGRPACELVIEYDPHPPFGAGTAESAGPSLVFQFEGIMAGMIARQRKGVLETSGR